MRPGVKGISENISVRSIIGRFLEHTRVFFFENSVEKSLFLCSADWMNRNFFKRVETCFPIEDTRLKKPVLDDLNNYLADNTQAWILQPEGTYQLIQKLDDEIKDISTQGELLESMAKMVS